MNLLMFNLAVDAEHVTLAFGLRWIEGLAKHYNRIDIVTMYEGKYTLPANVHVVSAGRERGYPLWIRVLRFYCLTIPIVLNRRPALAFSHMIPEFSILFWPIAKIMRIPSVLWYAHGHVPLRLRLAHKLVDHVVSSTPQGFRLPSDKVTFVGQGVDSSLYTYHPRRKGKTLNIISVGRLAPSKGQDKLMEALAEWRKTASMPWRLTLVGDATDDNEKCFAEHVRAQAAALLPAGSVTFTGRLDPAEIAPLVAEADVSISLGTTGSLDKTIVESMASGCPIFSCNKAFRAIALAEDFNDCVIDNTPKAICDVLTRFITLSEEDQIAIGKKQSAVALRDHTIDGLISRLISLLQRFAKKEP